MRSRTKGTATQATPLVCRGYVAPRRREPYALAKGCSRAQTRSLGHPEEFKEMVQQIRRLESMLGRPEKRPAAAEMEIRDLVRGRWIKD